MVRSPFGAAAAPAAVGVRAGRPTRRNRARLTATGLALALALSACGGDGSSDDGDAAGGDGGGKDGGTLTLGTVVPPASLAAKASNWSNGAPYLQAMYDSLLRQAPDGEVGPWLATEWSYNDDRTVLTMTLRDDVTFTDGTPFTAEVAAQNLVRFRDSAASPIANTLAALADAKAVDPTTLQLTLSAPEPALLIYLAQAAGAQESPASFDKPDEATNAVGSGPYVVDTKRTVVGSSYVFTKNDDYWAPDAQHYDEVVMNVYTTSQTIVSAVQGGQVNATAMLDTQSQPQVEAAGYEVQTNEINWAGLTLFDRTGQLNPALGDVRVRQAIAHSLDREALLEGSAGGYGTVTGQIFGPDNEAFIPELEDRYDYDPDRARELLADAGYEKGFTLEMPYFNTGQDAAFDLTEQYLKDVGITVKYTTVPLPDIATKVFGGQFPAALFPIQLFPTAWEIARFSIAQDGTWNVLHQPDETVAGLMATMQTGTEEEAASAAKELNEYVVEQAWFIPFLRGESPFVHDTDTEVVMQADNGYPQLQNIRPAG
jgi:peptide/nickel transport system substrate-binding protein